MLKIDSRKAGLVHFCSDKAPFSGKRAMLLQRAGIDNFIKPKMSTGSFGTDEKLKKTGAANVRPALERPAVKTTFFKRRSDMYIGETGDGSLSPSLGLQ